MIEALLVIILGAIAVGRLPVFRMNRATITLIGAVGLILLGALTLDEAIAAIDLKTIILLFAMMVFTANLRLAGFFQLAASSLSRLSHSPKTLLAVVVGLSALLSAFFVNDTVALMLTPILVEITLAAGLNPLPYLIGLAVSANIGSMATLVGNPQNILIGAASGIGFLPFSAALLAPTMLSLTASYLVIMLVSPQDFRKQTLAPLPIVRVRLYWPLLIKCALGLALMMGGILLGWGIVLSGLAGSAVMLFTRRIRPERVLSGIDGSLLVFFAALFVVTKAVQMRPVFDNFLQLVGPLMAQNLPLLGGVSALLSNLISNVPAVMLLQNFIPHFPDPQKAWIALAASSTLAGNLTLLGSVCNLIVAESARTRGVHLSFMAYLKVGLPVALVSLILTIGWLMLF